MPGVRNTVQQTKRTGVAVGPLVVSKSNPRYFAVDSREDRLVYLTGSHVNNNLHDGLGFGPECSAEPERFDFGDYLDFLEAHGHNFIRLWRWEQFKGQLPIAGVHCCMTSQPWPRTGPGAATDGKPKFDLDRFDPGFFDRLRERVVASGERGIYVSVMLFEGFSLHLTAAPDNIQGHPFHGANNVNGVGIRSIDDYQVLPLEPRVQAIQEAYIRKVVDTVHDLPNVLCEVANESSGGGVIDPKFAEQMKVGATAWGDSTRWQYWVIELIKQYEEEKCYPKHPVGMTMQFPVPDPARVNAPLFDGPADWISPGSGVGLKGYFRRFGWVGPSSSVDCVGGSTYEADHHVGPRDHYGVRGTNLHDLSSGVCAIARTLAVPI